MKRNSSSIQLYDMPYLRNRRFFGDESYVRFLSAVDEKQREPDPYELVNERVAILNAKRVFDRNGNLSASETIKRILAEGYNRLPEIEGFTYNIRKKEGRIEVKFSMRIEGRKCSFEWIPDTVRVPTDVRKFFEDLEERLPDWHQTRIDDSKHLRESLKKGLHTSQAKRHYNTWGRIEFGRNSSDD